MGIVGTTIIVMGITGLVAAVVLYFVAKKFHVYEDPRVAQIEEHLPGANCGGCGFSGCHAFAVACTKAKSLDGICCPGAGSKAMAEIGKIVGLAAVESARRVAVVRCNGSCAKRPHGNTYDGVRSCAIEAAFYGGETSCVYGCLGCGDCVEACPYDAMRLDVETGLPVVDRDKCVGCGKCVKACPRSVIELAEASESHEAVWVACVNHDKGALALKECEAACIGCGLCKRNCGHEAIDVSNFVAHIDASKCVGCGKCVDICPRGSILTAPAYNNNSKEEE